MHDGQEEKGSADPLVAAEREPRPGRLTDPLSPHLYRRLLTQCRSSTTAASFPQL
jgi:hypothetical protein